MDRKIKVEVLRDKDCKDFGVIVNNVTFQVDNFFDTTSMRFFLDYDKADSLMFHLGAALQDYDREQELKKGKASEELQEITPLERQE